MPLHPLTNFEIQKYYQNHAQRSLMNETRFNGVYSWENLSDKIKDRAYINLGDHSDIEAHWVALYVSNNDVTYFDSFGAELIPKEIKTFISSKNIKTNIFRIHEYDSIMYGYFCIGFINFILTGKTLTDFTNFFHQITLKKLTI